MLRLVSVVVEILSRCGWFLLCCANFVVLQLFCVVEISLCCGLFPLCCRDFFVLCIISLCCVNFVVF